MHDENISSYGENQKQIFIGGIVLGMLHNIRMLIGKEMQINGLQMQGGNDILLGIILNCDL
jgi:hypothetical protein